MICLTVDHLSLSFGSKPLLDDVTFSLDEGDRLGIIGANGCGKSTLFRMILGEQESDSGAVYISKNKTVGILRQDDALRRLDGESGEASALEIMYRAFPELLSMEARLKDLERELQRADGEKNAALAVQFTALNEEWIQKGGLEFRNRCASTLKRMGFDEETQLRPFSSLSGGQRTRLALSRELCREPDILMLDEPTNHLDMETVVWLESFLSSYKKCVLVISHDRYFLDRITNKTLCIEHRKGKLYRGGYTQSMEQRRIDREIEERHYKNQQKEIARQEAYIAQQRAWNREKNIVAAESRQKMLDKMVKLERPKEDLRPIKIRFSSSIASGNDVLTVKDVRFGYTDRALFSELSFLVKRGDRLFLTGPNGCGKSTLLKLLLGRLSPSCGYIETGYNVTVGYYDQENQNLTFGNTVLDELWNAYPLLTELEIRNTLARFRFFGEDVYKSVGELSGGERARLTLSKLLLSDINLLILDEPTNHLDIDSREALEEALAEFDGTIVAVSHDRYFLDKLATRLLDLSPNGAVDIRVGTAGRGYEELCRDRVRRETPTTAEKAGTLSADPSSQKEQYLKSKQEQAEARKQRNRLERLRAEATKLEEELETIESEMVGDAATDYVRLAELDTRKNAIEERLLELYEEI